MQLIIDDHNKPILDPALQNIVSTQSETVITTSTEPTNYVSLLHNQTISSQLEQSIDGHSGQQSAQSSSVEQTLECSSVEGQSVQSQQTLGTSSMEHTLETSSLESEQTSGESSQGGYCEQTLVVSGESVTEKVEEVTIDMEHSLGSSEHEQSVVNINIK